MSKTHWESTAAWPSAPVAFPPFPGSWRAPGISPWCTLKGRGPLGAVGSAPGAKMEANGQHHLQQFSGTGERGEAAARSAVPT